MKIVFIGCVRFSYYCLKEILDNNYVISGVCTLQESSFNNDFCDLTEISKKNTKNTYLTRIKSPRVI